jgi:hypothetical protein
MVNLWGLWPYCEHFQLHVTYIYDCWIRSGIALSYASVKVPYLYNLSAGTLISKWVVSPMSKFALITHLHLLVRATREVVSTNIGYIQWLSLTGLELKMTHVGRSCLLVGHTIKCGWTISCSALPICVDGRDLPSSTCWLRFLFAKPKFLHSCPPKGLKLLQSIWIVKKIGGDLVKAHTITF